MLLTRNQILQQIRKKLIEVTPFKKGNVGPGSLDLTLGDEFWVYPPRSTIILREATDYAKLTKKRRVKELRLEPGAFILGITKERIIFPDNICGLLSGRSRFARLGILVHATANIVHPGAKNRQMLEIKNISNNTLILRPGLKIAQISFIRTEGTASYAGRYTKQ